MGVTVANAGSRHLRPPDGARIAIAIVVLITGAACRSGGDDVAGRAVVQAGATTASTSGATPDIGGATPDSGGDDRGSGSRSQLDRSQSDTESDVARQVSETISDLDAAVVDGDTVFTLPEEVLFDFDQYDLRPDAAATLDRIAQAIVYFQDAPVRVAGHTDSHGSDDYNQRLSENRAQAVVDYLVDAGVNAGRVTPEGFGETQPVAPNENDDGTDNPEGRAQNRRVEIVIQGVDPAQVGQ
jgi:outer membrane protein OmpA-like peptidoglycan-associated protein